jgi:dimethylpropiothetin dethiomethylase
MESGPMAEQAEAMPEGSRLGEHPDWRYLLRELYLLYRFSSAGGSRRIRSHQKEVRHRLSRVLDRDPAMRFPKPDVLPVCTHLRRALDQGMGQSTDAITRAVEHVVHALQWEYGYDVMPARLSSRYAFAELLGPRGPVVADDLILGLVLFAPGTTYPTHSHSGITESYFCLSGAMSENDNGVYNPGSLILNPPEQMHRITTGDHEPCLLAYAWVGTQENLTNHKLVFSRPRKSKSAAP